MIHAVSLEKDVSSALVPDLDLMQRLDILGKRSCVSRKRLNISQLTIPHNLYPVALDAISSVCKRPTPRTQGLGKFPFTLGDIAGQI